MQPHEIRRREWQAQAQDARSEQAFLLSYNVYNTAEDNSASQAPKSEVDRVMIVSREQGHLTRFRYARFSSLLLSLPYPEFSNVSNRV
jgi:hypothetical protein